MQGLPLKLQYYKALCFLCAYGVKAQIPLLVIGIFCTATERRRFLISFCYWLPVANAVSETGDESSLTWMYPHTQTHTPGPAEVSSSIAHGWYIQDPMDWNTPHTAVSIWCSLQVDTIYKLTYKARNFCRYWAGNPFTCPIEPIATEEFKSQQWHHSETFMSPFPRVPRQVWLPHLMSEFSPHTLSF